MTTILSDEQEGMITSVLNGSNVIVDAVVGAGKTTAIQELCNRMPKTSRILYLTYNRLLKLDARRRIRRRNVRVQNYHGFVYPALKNSGLGDCGISQSINVFNDHFDRVKAWVPAYDLLVIDEYQDIREEMATLLNHIKSLNPSMRIVAVGDMEQKIYDNTRLDVRSFITKFAAPCRMLGFTHTFRMGPDMGERLGEAWGKPIVGTNAGQRIRFMNTTQAYRYASTLEPDRFMMLGPRNGAMTKILNRLETEYPDTFNKHTVYASIRDSDKAMRNNGDVGQYRPDCAIFTTFDSSKGLERDICFVCGFDPKMWQIRISRPDVDATIMRNKFLVAASRGKNEIIFVGSGRKPTGYDTKHVRLGYIPIAAFTAVESDPCTQVYQNPFEPSDCFDFTYMENVEEAHTLVDAQDTGSKGSDIAIDSHDGLIDLSPAIGDWQEAMFFTRYSVKTAIKDAVMLNPKLKAIGEEAIKRLNGEPWHDILGLTAMQTSQRRYLDQADDHRITHDLANRVRTRMSRILSPDDPPQVPMGMSGLAVNTQDGTTTPIAFHGRADTIHDGVVYELKFVGELTHEMTLQLALYLVMGGHDAGVLWNVRTNQKFVIRVPDRPAFMNAVVTTITKQHYNAFHGAIPPITPRT